MTRSGNGHSPSPRSEAAWESYGFQGGGPLLVTAEHASNRVPAPLRTTASDRFWLETHWGYDIGVRTTCRELVRLTGSQAVMARFSRLVCDPNRAPGTADFVRVEVEGTPLSFNRKVDETEVRRRVEAFHTPYHRAIDAALRARLGQDRDVLLLSVHSFTPVWNHRVRTMDLGILASRHEAVASRLARFTRAAGFETAINEPYSALDGLIYAAERHGETHGVVYLELELNQATVCTPQRARRTARMLAAALAGLRLRQTTR